MEVIKTHINVSHRVTEITNIHSHEKWMMEEFLEDSKGNIYFCSKDPGSDSNLNDIILGFCTFIGMSVSLISLFMTFIIYCFLPDLQTKPGKCLMNLIVSLFMGNALFLIRPQTESHPQICLTIPICAHFFWLSSFKVAASLDNPWNDFLCLLCV